MIIDAHTHVTTNKNTGDWNPEDSIAAADTYRDHLSSCGVSKGFAFMFFRNLVDPQKDNDVLARARDRQPDTIVPWGTVGLRWSESQIRAEIRRCIRDLGFSGIKLHPWVQGTSLSWPGTSVVAEECIALDVPLTFHDGTPTYCSAIQGVYLARAFPQLRVISGHAGLSEQWRDVVRPAQELANYWLCVPSPTTQQALEYLYKHVGPDKLVFGSDGGRAEPSVIRRALSQMQALGAPAEDMEKMMWKNALKLVKMA
jgi:uncharacterized protein